jgi:glycosyltransferase involved in cell wall biosynthesis
MTKGSKVFVVMPAYNEADNIADVIRRVPELVDKIIVVDDGSADNNYAFKKDLNRKIIRHSFNKGYGASVKAGSRAANGDVANKIGTYSPGILARQRRIPLYIAATSSTFDLSIKRNTCRAKSSG